MKRKVMEVGTFLVFEKAKRMYKKRKIIDFNIEVFSDLLYNTLMGKCTQTIL